MTNHMQANQWAIKQKNIISKLNITALYWESLHRINSCIAYVLLSVQGADDKLGQFLNQGI
jgi:hypothetical protein